MLLNNCMKFHQDLFNCFQDIVPNLFCRKLLFYMVQKHNKEELLFLCSERYLKYICIKFHQNEQELCFLHSAHHLYVLNICTCMKFHEASLNGFKVIEQARFCHRN